MDSVAAQVILDGVASRAGIGRDEVTGELLADLRDWLERRLKEGRERWPWQRLELAERRWFRSWWDDATAYAAGDEVWHAPEGKYFQALTATTAGEEPGSSAKWVECARQPVGELWDASTDYAAGTAVEYDGTIYAAWQDASAGTVPTDTDYWGEQAEFELTIDRAQAGETVIGPVRSVSLKNPKTQRAAQPMDWEYTGANGLRAWPLCAAIPSFVWVSFVERAPALRGNPWDDTASYTALGSGTATIKNQIYFRDDDAGTPGNFYNCISAAAAGESPATDAAKWSLVEIPEFLTAWLIATVYADYLESDGQKAKALAELAAAEGLLEQQVLPEDGRTRRATVMSR